MSLGGSSQGLDSMFHGVLFGSRQLDLTIESITTHKRSVSRYSICEIEIDTSPKHYDHDVSLFVLLRCHACSLIQYNIEVQGRFSYAYSKALPWYPASYVK